LRTVLREMWLVAFAAARWSPVASFRLSELPGWTVEALSMLLTGGAG